MVILKLFLTLQYQELWNLEWWGVEMVFYLQIFFNIYFDFYLYKFYLVRGNEGINKGRYY